MIARSPRVWLIDIREEIEGIRGLTKDADLHAFVASWGMKRAVEHALLIIAEAAKHLPQSMKDARPEVPWSKIHGLGNLLRHEYRHVDPEVLWSIVTGQLNELDDAAAALLENLDEAGGKDL
ncbi:MAG TPA: HepT-like ribonuclease domain-containing protein [Roseiarcus sp.]|nr:HepT-like ribonuclease domain-containing protein [Roseiarcus sp.]